MWSLFTSQHGGRFQCTIKPCWLWQIPRLLARFKVDIVNTHSPVPFMADIVALFSKSRPVVLTYHCKSLLKGRPRYDFFLMLCRAVLFTPIVLFLGAARDSFQFRPHL